MLDIKRVIASSPRKPTAVDLRPLSTPWTDQARRAGEGEPVHPRPRNHPHPQFERDSFQILDGWWDYRFTAADDARTAWCCAPLPSAWDGRILVPFSPEAPLSGVGRQLKPDELLWYRRTIPFPDGLQAGNRCLLHFEAVDYACACYCNGVLLGTHIGGYLPFSFDITDALASGENEIAACVYDPSDQGVQLRGKQRLERGGIWYTAQSGLWQSVWLEVVPERRIESIAIDAQPEAGRLEVAVTVCEGVGADEAHQPEAPLTVTLLDGGEAIGWATSDSAQEAPVRPESGRGVAGADPDDAGTGCMARFHTLAIDVDDPHLWSPEDPHLYHLEITYGDDRVRSYCAFRTITMEEDAQGTMRLHINHEPVFLKGVLDQGYWPDGLMTAPSDDALVHDIETMKDLGFNTLRKHIKIERDRWYYHCDRLGMLVWQDMVCGGSQPKPWHTSYKPTFFRRSWGNFSDASPHYSALSAESDAFRTEWRETCLGAITHLRNHPSIVIWSLFNEGWGQFDAREATDMVRSLDPTRAIEAVSGWYDQACGDFLSVHNYFRPLEVYEDGTRPGRAFALSEFGGLSYHFPEHSSLSTSYGYESYSDIGAYREAVGECIGQACSLEQHGLAGFVYTQLSDVEEETNGLLTYDRRINKLADGGRA